MKKSELRQMIKEEAKKILKEAYQKISSFSKYNKELNNNFFKFIEDKKKEANAALPKLAENFISFINEKIPEHQIKYESITEVNVFPNSSGLGISLTIYISIDGEKNKYYYIEIHEGEIYMAFGNGRITTVDQIINEIHRIVSKKTQ